ncbi:MAG: hypothetical protein EA377_09750 [Phycisphaerales bacterium]|nr:MAG: hypothetical protein EA377_09750 [Phycisphaerales bacterium]
MRTSTAILATLAIIPSAWAMAECDVWEPFGDGFNSSIPAVHTYDGDLIALTNFSSHPDIDGVARWNGEFWEQLGEGLFVLGPSDSLDMITFEGDLIAIGPIALQDESHYRFVRWDGDSWQAIGNQACAGSVNAVAVAGGELYLGLGNNADCEHHIDGFDNPIRGVIRWNGEYWSEVGDTSEFAYVSAMVEYDGDLVAADYNVSTQIGSIRRWNGESWEHLSTFEGGGVTALAVYNGSLIAGGAFELMDGLPLQRIARYDGEQWLAMTLGMDDTVRELHVHDGELYAGGRFETVAENPADRLVRWNGLTWVEFEGGADGRVRSMASYQGNLVIAGNFSDVGDGVNVNRIAQFVTCPDQITGACCTSGGCVHLTLEACDAIGGAYLGDDVTCAEADCATCPGDLNLDGVVDVLDLLELLNAWGSCP